VTFNALGLLVIRSVEVLFVAGADEKRCYFEISYPQLEG